MKRYQGSGRRRENGRMLGKTGLESKNAAPDAANIESGAETMVSRITEGTASAFDSIIERNSPQVVDYLLCGEENAIPARQLAEMFGLEDTRDVRKLISIERERTVILSAARRGGGYFLPDAGAKGKSEIACFLAMMDARKRHNNRVTETARKALREIDGQQAIEEDDGGGGEKDS